MTANAATALAAWPWQVAGEMLKWIADGDPMKLLIPIAVGEKSIAFPRRSVKAGVDRTHKLCFSSAYAAEMAFLIPLNLSARTTKMSCTPRFFSSFSTLSQNFALSFSPIVMLRTSFRPSLVMPRTT